MELRSALPPVKTIAMSGGGLGNAASYLRAAKLLGAVKVLEKPFSKEALLTTVNEALADGK
jgi:FixJ family two-component response regulator